jgi:DNA-binding transcriptional LysR family regulator
MICGINYLHEISWREEIIFLDQHHFILLDESMSFLEVKSWLDRKVENPAGMIKINSMITLVQLYEAGLGIVAFPDYPKAFLYPQLKRIMGLPKFKERSLWILNPKNMVRSKKIRLPTDFFYQELKHFIMATDDHS